MHGQQAWQVPMAIMLKSLSIVANRNKESDIYVSIAKGASVNNVKENRSLWNSFHKNIIQKIILTKTLYSLLLLKSKGKAGKEIRKKIGLWIILWTWEV